MAILLVRLQQRGPPTSASLDKIMENYKIGKEKLDQPRKVKVDKFLVDENKFKKLSLSIEEIYEKNSESIDDKYEDPAFAKRLHQVNYGYYNIFLNIYDTIRKNIKPIEE